MKGKIISVSLFLLLSLFSSCSYKNDTPYRSVSQIQKSGVIKIAVYSDKKPFCYIDKYGNYQGYDVYFANRIAKDLNVTPEFVSVTASTRLSVLNSGKADIILANMTRTADRIELADFALPYMKVSLGVVSREGDLIRHIEELSGRTVLVNKGTTAQDYFKALADSERKDDTDQNIA